MAYADYEFYAVAFLGTAIAEADFPRLASRASDYLDYITLGKASSTEAVQKACCALAEQYQRIELAQELARKTLSAAVENAESGELQSQSVGGWSKSYRSGGDSAASAASVVEEETKRLYTVAKQYLAHTGLLYRGGGRKCSHIL